MDYNNQINSNIFTISAFTIGILLCDELTPAEQNSLGNWFMLVGQALCTNASQQQVINNKNKTSNSNNIHIVNSNLSNSANNIKKEVNKIFSEYR